MASRFLLVGIWLMGSLAGIASSESAVFLPGRASFSIRFRNEISPYKVMGIFALPGETMLFEVVDGLAEESYSFSAAGGIVERTAAQRWKFTAPRTPGLYPAQLGSGAEAVTLNIFVMVPRQHKKDGMLNGYRIGKYPVTPLRGLDIYKPPPGFIEVTRENEETPLSPHFKLVQFLCKQEGDYPKYVVLDERLLLKLELILERVNDQGIYADTFAIMSSYRTPYYNRAIGNVPYSRHIYGDAADIFIDMHEPHGTMDDLNGDGQSDHRDATVLCEIIEELYDLPWYEPLIGGLGLYRERAHRGPFVHIDVRGTLARWGR